MSTIKSCPVSGGFCYRNPVQVLAVLALLPWAAKGVAWVWAGVHSFASALGN